MRFQIIEWMREGEGVKKTTEPPPPPPPPAVANKPFIRARDAEGFSKKNANFCMSISLVSL